MSTTPYICASLFVLVLARFPFTIVYHRVPSMIVDCIITDNTRRYVVSRKRRHGFSRDKLGELFEFECQFCDEG